MTKFKREKEKIPKKGKALFIIMYIISFAIEFMLGSIDIFTFFSLEILGFLLGNILFSIILCYVFIIIEGILGWYDE